jgi:hypothetical protein
MSDIVGFLVNLPCLVLRPGGGGGSPDFVQHCYMTEGFIFNEKEKE